MASPKLSVILPVYNAQDTLVTCVESVLSQSFASLELIIVDDGSTDSSGKLCDQLSTAHACITIIHQENSGPSSARNRALDVVKGEYITFIDADDIMGEHTLLPLMQLITAHPDYDIIEYPAHIYYKSRRESVLQLTEQVYHDMEAYWLQERVYDHAYVWNKIFRRSLFTGTYFRKGMLFEDMWLLPKLLAKADVVATTSIGCYYYYSRTTSLTHELNAEKWQMLLQTHLDVIKQLAKQHAAEMSFQNYYLQVLNIQLELYRWTSALLLPTHSISFKTMRGKGLQAKLKIIIYKLFGIRTLCKIYKAVKHNPS